MYFCQLLVLLSNRLVQNNLDGLFLLAAHQLHFWINTFAALLLKSCHSQISPLWCHIRQWLTDFWLRPLWPPCFPRGERCDFCCAATFLESRLKEWGGSPKATPWLSTSFCVWIDPIFEHSLHQLTGVFEGRLVSSFVWAIQMFRVYLGKITFYTWLF